MYIMRSLDNCRMHRINELGPIYTIDARVDLNGIKIGERCIRVIE